SDGPHPADRKNRYHPRDAPHPLFAVEPAYVSGSLLGVDLGDRRVGLALADADTRLARPFRTVRRGATVADDVAVLRRICGEQRVPALVVGLPSEESGIEGPMAAAAREWAAAVGEALGLPVTLR